MSFFAVTGIAFPFLMTALGAAVVYLFRSRIDARAQRICMGFAGGVMAAATAFSMLVPAQLMMGDARAWLWLPAAFLLGAAAVGLLNRLLRRADFALRQGADAQRRMTFLSAIVLHNIPEGMAVGLAFAPGGAGAAAAAAVALGIGLQNLPEGAAVSLPLRQGGMSRRRAFLLGMLSGAVEPVGALLTVWFSSLLTPALPCMLAFAAGAMIYVVVESLIPETQAGAHSNLGTLMFALGFTVMMALDCALG